VSFLSDTTVSRSPHHGIIGASSRAPLLQNLLGVLVEMFNTRLQAVWDTTIMPGLAGKLPGIGAVAQHGICQIVRSPDTGNSTSGSATEHPWQGEVVAHCDALGRRHALPPRPSGRSRDLFLGIGGSGTRYSVGGWHISQLSGRCSLVERVMLSSGAPRLQGPCPGLPEAEKE
jgi:hypothetical protein